MNIINAENLIKFKYNKKLNKFNSPKHSNKSTKITLITKLLALQNFLLITFIELN